MVTIDTAERSPCRLASSAYRQHVVLAVAVNSPGRLTMPPSAALGLSGSPADSPLRWLYIGC